MILSPESYLFTPGRRSILAEIYFPKRVSMQGKIHDTLKQGLYPKNIRAYLKLHVRSISKELSAYRHWFDPNRYKNTGETPSEFTLAEKKDRMEMWEPVFYGWSTYEVNGVFLKRNGKTIDEELTQVLRLIFKFDDTRSFNQAVTAGHSDVYRAILYWVLSEFGHTDDYRAWTKEERERFLSRHPLWKEEKKVFARKLYPVLARKVAKWIADSGLFIFGFLVREFWRKIILLHKEEKSRLEDEIWVTSIFHINVNTMTPYRK